MINFKDRLKLEELYKYESELRKQIWNEAIEAAAKVVAIELGNTVEDDSYYIEREIRKLKK